MGNFMSSPEIDHKMNGQIDTTSTVTDDEKMSRLCAANSLDRLDALNIMCSEGEVSTYFTGTHEVQECLEGQGEADLHTHLTKCTKNPGHEGSLPIKYLAFGCNNDDLYDLTKALADITVRIAVKFTSPDRPEYVPGTKDPYPCYKTRGQNSLRTGTGYMGCVTKHIEGTCPCPECDHSDTHSKVWWEVRVMTATHVVFDESEVRQSSCRLWFDDNQSPVVKIYGWRKCSADIERDSCWWSYVTHDLKVGEKLEKMKDRLKFKDLCHKVKDNYKNRRDVDKLTIIVSHPHGCSKQVSVGHWVDREVVRNNNYKVSQETRYTYTTCTCPGSSGAQVYRLGCDGLTNLCLSGVSSGGLNYSSIEFD